MHQIALEGMHLTVQAPAQDQATLRIIEVAAPVVVEVILLLIVEADHRQVDHQATALVRQVPEAVG